MARPEPEVIMNFADGCSYVKAKLDEAYLNVIGPSDAPTTTSKQASTACKKEDIDLLVNEFEISRTKAEKLLIENDRDLGKTIRALVE